MRAQEAGRPAGRYPCDRMFGKVSRRQKRDLVHGHRIAVAHGAVLRRTKEATVLPEELSGAAAVADRAGDWARQVEPPGAFEAVRPEEQGFHERLRGRREEVPNPVQMNGRCIDEGESLDWRRDPFGSERKPCEA